MSVVPGRHAVRTVLVPPSAHSPRAAVSPLSGLLTGLHEPRASHLLMLEAVAGRPLLTRCYTEALEHRYLWHEFGDVNLLLAR